MWYQPTDWLNYEDQILFTHELSIYHKYLYAFYYSVLFLGTNEIGPVNKTEIVICALFLMANLIV